MILRALLFASLLLGCGFDAVTESWKQRRLRSEIHALEQDLAFERIHADEVTARYEQELRIAFRQYHDEQRRQRSEAMDEVWQASIHELESWDAARDLQAGTGGLREVESELLLRSVVSSMER